MSGLEIERKFLIREGSDYKSAAFSHSRIKQGYMPCQTATVRVRTRDDRSWLTIKSHSDRAGLSRYEFEKEITNDEAEHLFELCRGGVIDKCRWLVKSPDGRHTFEVDEFFGDNAGLVGVAEVRLAGGVRDGGGQIKCGLCHGVSLPFFVGIYGSLMYTYAGIARSLPIRSAMLPS